MFHLVRHAAHDQLGKYLTGRSGGVSLSVRGRGQAGELARLLAKEHFDAIRTSPQSRARETADVIAAEQATAVELSEELDEIDFGRWSGLSFEALDRDPDWKLWNERRGTARTPGGDTMRDVTNRVVALIDRLRADHRGGVIALVSHCDVIKACLCHYLGLPFERMDRFEIDPASVSTIAAGDWGGKVLALNRTARAGDAR